MILHYWGDKTPYNPLSENIQVKFRVEDVGPGFRVYVLIGFLVIGRDKGIYRGTMEKKMETTTQK